MNNELSKRERDVLELVAKGMTNKKIADNLHISPVTVMTYVTNLKNKLTANSKLQLVIEAIKRGLIDVR